MQWWEVWGGGVHPNPMNRLDPSLRRLFSLSSWTNLWTNWDITQFNRNDYLKDKFLNRHQLVMWRRWPKFTFVECESQFQIHSNANTALLKTANQRQCLINGRYRNHDALCWLHLWLHHYWKWLVIIFFYYFWRCLLYIYEIAHKTRTLPRICIWQKRCLKHSTNFKSAETFEVRTIVVRCEYKLRHIAIYNSQMSQQDV